MPLSIHRVRRALQLEDVRRLRDLGRFELDAPAGALLCAQLLLASCRTLTTPMTTLMHRLHGDLIQFGCSSMLSFSLLSL